MWGELWEGVGGGKRSKSPKVQWFKGPGVLRSQGPKDQDISNSHSNTSLTLKKVYLVLVHLYSTEQHNILFLLLSCTFFLLFFEHPFCPLQLVFAYFLSKYYQTCSKKKHQTLGYCFWWYSFQLYEALRIFKDCMTINWPTKMNPRIQDQSKSNLDVTQTHLWTYIHLLIL